jgi:TrmH family RNA methyltransferase
MDAEMITSRQNPLVKSICGLAEKKKRVASGLFRFDGIKLLGELLQTDILPEYVVLRESADERAQLLARAAAEKGARVITVSESVFEKMTDERSPEGVITVAKMPTYIHGTASAQSIDALAGGKSRILLVESLRDPGNLGTVIRSCYALGIECLVLTADCADLYNSKTVRAAMGAIFKLPTLTVAEGALPDCIRVLREGGRAVYAAALHTDALTLGEISPSVGDCFVIGNEGHGLDERTVAACTAPVVIPMREGAESLNASAAAAICIWETVRAK